MKDTKLIHHSNQSWQTISEALDKCRRMEKNPKNWTVKTRYNTMLRYMQRTLKMADDMHLDSLEEVKLLRSLLPVAETIRMEHLLKETANDQ